MIKVQLVDEQKRAQRLIKSKAALAGLCVLVFSLLLLPLLPVPAFSLPGWIPFIGRFHPIIVHFPLALVPLLVLFEVVSFFKPDFPSNFLRRLMWKIAALTSITAVAAGYFLYGSDTYDGELITEHLWGGVISTSFILIASYISHTLKPALNDEHKTLTIYRIAIGLALMAILHTGHHGGMLTHGSSFLTNAFPYPVEADVTSNKSKAELVVFEDLIFPILEQKCLSCHNDNKTKGGLKMTTLQFLMQGGDSEKPLIVPHNSPDSELLRRILLPAGDDDSMPPEGKSPLSSLEIKLVDWWIAAGANEAMVFGDGPADSTLRLNLNALANKQLARQRRRMQQQKNVLDEAQEINKALPALLVEPDADNHNTSLAVSMKIPPLNVNDETIASLVSFTDNITRLSLAGSEITDDALFHISNLTNLQALYLSYTALDGTGLPYIQDLSSLEIINLSYTKVTNDGALHLTKMPALSMVYLHGTNVDSVMVDALDRFLQNVDVSVQVGPLHH